MHSLLFFLLSPSADAAAPWPVVIVATLPQPPAQMAVYEVIPTDPFLLLRDVQDTFGVAGQPLWNDRLGGNVHAEDDSHYAWAFSDGGVMYHDDSALSAEIPMKALSNDDLWASAEGLLWEVGAFEKSAFELLSGRIGVEQATVTDERGRTVGPWVTAQSVSFSYQLDGYPVFGAGGETTVEFGPTGILSFSDAQRNLDIAELLVPDAPQVALQRWMDRADDEHRWSMYRSYIQDVQRVRIDSITLGYYAPASGAESPTLEPVYEIRGAMLGHDAQGHRTAVDLLWWEPACTGRTIPDINLSTVQ